MAHYYKFIDPQFLQNKSSEEIMSRMLARIPDSYDKSEGSVLRDILTPVALELAETCEFQLAQALRNVFPMFSDDMLDAHGQSRSIIRKPAVKATGQITVTGTAGTIIDPGTIVSTTSERDSDPVIEFVTDAEATLDAYGNATINITALRAGRDGNVAAGAINRMPDAMSGISTISNDQPTAGGLDEEEDEDYRDRIVDYDQSWGESFVGSVSDYKRWALEVNGVGTARVITPNDGSGMVTIVITASDGSSASEELQTQVYNYIMSPDDPISRKAPVDANLTVSTPETVTVEISATLTIDTQVTTLQNVTDEFIELVSEYYQEIDDGYVRYSKIGQILMGIRGVIDYQTLLINDNTDNIELESDEIASTTSEDVIFS